MRHPTSRENIDQVMRAIGDRIREPLKVYFTGGTTCVLKGWRETTVDIDLKPVPDLGKVYDVISGLKDELSVNIETAAPDHFLPPLPGWEDRSEHIGRVGQVEFYHYDIYSQLLSKVARGFKKDLADARKMAGAIDSGRLRDLFDAIRPGLVRYPAVDEKILTEKLNGFLDSLGDGTA
jgi:hypothetical protein